MCQQCPSQNDLSEYSLGKLSEEVSGGIERHLEQCGSCQAFLETLGRTDDTFLAALRNQRSPNSWSQEDECMEAVARIVAIGRDPSIVAEQTPHAANETGGTVDQIGPYRLLGQLGAGGMGTVYKALHTRLQRVVAIKLLPADRLQDRQAVARFEREMVAVGQLVHPNIVLAHDAGEVDGRHFLVMELVEGQDLSELVRHQGPLPIADACEIIRQVAVGLQHVHQLGLVHRDIKPGNVMLTIDGDVKVLDLGLALLTEATDADGELTRTGMAMGTLDYMAPEQSGDSHEVDIRADIYSLGATLYKLLCGRSLYSGSRYRTRMQKWKALLTEDAPSIDARRPDVPADLAAVVHRMIERERDDRYATPAEVAEQLEPFCHGADLVALGIAAPQQASQENESRNPSQSTLSMRQRASAIDTIPESQPPLSQQKTEAGSLPAASIGRGAGRRRRTLAMALAGFVLLALVLVYRSGEGTVEIRIPPGAAADDIQVEILQGGEIVEVVSAQSGWAIRLQAGQYTLRPKGSHDQFLLDRDRITVRRWGREVAAVHWKPGREPSSATAAEPATNRAGPVVDKPASPAEPPNTPEQSVDSPEQRITGHPALDRLRERVEAITSNDPEDETVVALRNDLIALQQEVAGQPVVTKVGQLMAQVPWPVDALNAEDISEYERERIGNGVPKPVGKELVVGVAGDSRLMHWEVPQGAGVQEVFWMPDGRTVLSVGNCGRVSLWDSVNGMEKASYWHGNWGDHRYSGATLSSDGRLLAVGSVSETRERELRLLDVQTGELLKVLEQSGHPGRSGPDYVPCFSADGRFLAVAVWDFERDGELAVRDTATGEVVVRLQPPAMLDPTLAFSPDGSLLACAATDRDGTGAVRVWNWQTSTIRLDERVEWNKTPPIQFGPHSKQVLMTARRDDNDWCVRAWDIADRSVAFEINTTIPCRELAYSPDGTRIFLSENHHRILDSETREHVAELNCASDSAIPAIISGAFRSDGQVLATGDDFGAVRFWNTSSGKEIVDTDMPVYRGLMSAVSVTPDGRKLVTGAAQSVCITDLSTRKLRACLPLGGGMYPESISIDSTSSRFGVANRFGESILGRFPEPSQGVATWGSVGGSRDIAFAISDGTALSIGEQPTRGLDVHPCHDQSARKPRRTLLHETVGGGFAAVAFDDTGQRIAGVRFDGQVRIWDRDSGKILQKFTAEQRGNASAIDFSPDGRLLAVGSQFVVLVNSDSGREIQRVAAGSSQMDFSADGRWLAVNGRGQPHELTVFDLSTGTAEFEFRLGICNDVAFTPDSRHLITANGNGTAYIIRLQELE